MAGRKKIQPKATTETLKAPRDWSTQIDKVLGLISEGESVTEACRLAEMTKANFLKLVDGDRYARARDAQADTHFAGMVDLERQCLEGEIDPQAYRAAMDTRKWRLARMKPTVYGDRSQVDHTITTAMVMGSEACEESAMKAKAQLDELRAARKGGKETA